MEFIKRIWGTKTLKVAVAGILTAVGAFVGEQISLAEMVQAIFMGIATLTIRDGIKKAE